MTKMNSVVLLRRSTRKLQKSSRVPRSPFFIFLAHFFQWITIGCGAHPLLKKGQTKQTWKFRNFVLSLSFENRPMPVGASRRKSSQIGASRRKSAIFSAPDLKSLKKSLNFGKLLALIKFPKNDLKLDFRQQIFRLWHPMTMLTDIKLENKE